MLSFKQFILSRTIKGKRGWLEALARYIQNDEHFPDRGYYVLQSYLQSTGADDEILDAFEYAYNGPYTKYMKDCQRVNEGLQIRHEVYERCDCYHDEGGTREEFKRRPELALLAVIAKGLFDIADAIRERN